MKLDGRQIKKYRESKGLTQKELATKTNLNTRTIQRIENEETQTRAFTLNRIAEVLDFPVEDLESKDKYRNVLDRIFKFVGLVIINLGIVLVFGFLTINNYANFNSIIAALILSGCLPFLVLYFSKDMNPEERLLKFAIGLWLYVIAFLILHDPQVALSKGLIYAVIIFSFVLYTIGKKSTT